MKYIGLLIALPLLVILKIIVWLVMIYAWFRDLPTRLDEGRVRKRGVPVRGWWVQANNSLWKKGTNDSPGMIAFSLDQRASNELLKQIAREVGRLKSEPATTPTEATEAKIVADEFYVPGRRIKLPHEFTDEVPIYCADVMVRRRYLPERIITSPYADFRAIPTGKPTTVAMTGPK